MIKNFINILLAALVLSGCATIKPVSKQAIENKTFVLVPTGQINYEVVSNRGGAAFGLIGALIEAAVTQSSSDVTKEKLRTAVPPEFLLQIAANQIEADLKKYGNYKLIITKQHTLKDMPHSDWSKNTKREDLKGNPDINGDIILDVGVTDITLVKNLFGTTANLWVSLRMINRETGEVHGEVRDLFMSEGINVDFDEDSPAYASQIKGAFELLVRDSVNKSLSYLFFNKPSKID